MIWRKWWWMIYENIFDGIQWICSFGVFKLNSIMLKTVKSSFWWRFASTLYSQITLLTVPRRKKKCIRYLQGGWCASPTSSDGSAIDSPPSPVDGVPPQHPSLPSSPSPASPSHIPLHPRPSKQHTPLILSKPKTTELSLKALIESSQQHDNLNHHHHDCTLPKSH